VKVQGLLRSLEFFWGFFRGFLGCFEWLGPNHNYFLETKDPAAISSNVQGPRRNLQQAQGLLC
jgi:hypothetical protein